MLTQVEIADKTSSITLAMWNEDANKVQMNKSYKFEKIIVKSFEDIKSLSVSPVAIITEIDDIDDVASTSVQKSHEELKITGTTTTVSVLKKHFCLHCQYSFLLDPDEKLTVVKCQKCNQKMLKSNLKSIITLKMNINNMNISASNDVIIECLEKANKQDLVENIDEFESILLQSNVEISHINGTATGIKFT